MKFCFIGEAMIEVAKSANTKGAHNCQIGFAGDTLNTAIHLARFGHEVSYFSAIGNDPFSQDFETYLHQEAVKTELIIHHPTRHMGLYAIRTDDNGERSFQYWRDSSAAKDMFEFADLTKLSAAFLAFDYICFSLISLAILPDEGREKLLELCAKARTKGVKIVFDGNYRPKLWQGSQDAAYWRDRAIAICDIGLPTFDDEVAISGFETIEDCWQYWQMTGASETIVKDGVQGCLIQGSKRVLPPKPLKPVDTSGAGDAFNAGYLCARSNALTPQQCALKGHELAAWVIMNSGAIPEKNATSPY